jgi:hydroxymethylglutaryl-CoA lyase
LLDVGFDTLDCGSFVSAKAIPQMADTGNVIGKLTIKNNNTKLLVIVANLRGGEEAAAYENITYLGFPFSISPTFQLRNANSTLEESLQRVEDIQNLCVKNNKQLVVYLSMGFGNPYGDEYNEEILLKWADKLVERDIKIISIADTVGVAEPEQISIAVSKLISTYRAAEVGVHLHSKPSNRRQKLAAALNAAA